MNTKHKAIVKPIRLGDLLADINDGRIVIQPKFQRRLVWTNTVKDRFIETVLNGFPFPEIFVASPKAEGTKLRRIQWLVDGQQRMNALRQYFAGDEDLVLKSSTPYTALSEDDQEAFSDYLISVRDLGVLSEEEIKHIFARINSTNYPLKAMERLHALFDGEFKKYCEKLSRNNFFESRRVFSVSDYKRMRDLDFCVILVATMMSTYFQRDEQNEEFMKMYDDEFADEQAIDKRLANAFKFIDECDLNSTRRAWKKTDLLTLIVEVDASLRTKKKPKTPKGVGLRLRKFYAAVDRLFDEPDQDSASEKAPAGVASYLKAATKATNDKYSRMVRAKIIRQLLTGTPTRTSN